jgi:hypothetical protein
MNENELGKIIVDSAIEVHGELGGLGLVDNKAVSQPRRLPKREDLTQSRNGPKAQSFRSLAPFRCSVRFI